MRTKLGAGLDHFSIDPNAQDVAVAIAPEVQILEIDRVRNKHGVVILCGASCAQPSKSGRDCRGADHLQFHVSSPRPPPGKHASPAARSILAKRGTPALSPLEKTSV